MSIAAPAVEAELARVSALRAQLLAEVPDLDEDTLRDTVEGLTDLPALLASVVRSQLEDEAWAIALRGRLDNMHERLTRIELRIEKTRLRHQGDGAGRSAQAGRARVYRLAAAN